MIPTAPPRVGPPLLHDPAPEFRARTTVGDIALSNYRGRWLLLFSHPADFTPVCTSEFIAFSRASARFDGLGCALLALSVDSLFSHVAWIRSIHQQFGVAVPFPIIEDPSMAIAAAYGMNAQNAPDAALVRAAFVIDPGGIIRAISWYPMTTGHHVEELLRLLAALQTFDQHGVSTPEGWMPGNDVILQNPLTTDQMFDTQAVGSGWYYRTGRFPVRLRGQKRPRLDETGADRRAGNGRDAEGAGQSIASAHCPAPARRRKGRQRDRG